MTKLKVKGLKWKRLKVRGSILPPFFFKFFSFVFVKHPFFFQLFWFFFLNFFLFWETWEWKLKLLHITIKRKLLINNIPFGLPYLMGLYFKKFRLPKYFLDFFVIFMKIKIDLWQKCKTDPLTFNIFHFNYLTFSFIISVF